MFEITVPGEPRGKGRPRFFQRKGGGVGTFTPEATASYENLIKTLAVQAMAGRPPERGAMWLHLTIFHPIPASKSKRVKEEMRTGLIRPTGKPDMDNVLKAVMDGLNGVAFDDDKQVVTLMADRWYGDTPQVRVSTGPVKAELSQAQA